MIRVGIIGAAGYTGGELIRILLQHPLVDIVFAHSNSQAGKPIASIHQDLFADTELNFADSWNFAIDVLFLCVGHGEAMKSLSDNEFDPEIKIVDLSQDFRLHKNSVLDSRVFVYGLPELNRLSIKSANNIANPGCFATALQLGLLPLVADGFHDIIHTTGITGSTGAGQSLSSSSHFSWRANNIQAYKSLNHQHINEVTESLTQCSSVGVAPQINFIPWRGDFPRGIFVSQQFTTEVQLSALNEMYRAYYHDHPFVHLTNEPLHLKQVLNTNKCLIYIEQQGGATVVHSAIDNLLKGASGQAVQNMNLMMGLDETTGLKLKASWF